MRSNELRHGLSARRCTQRDGCFGETKNRPPIFMSQPVELGISGDSLCPVVPVRPIGLNDQAGVFKHEVRLKTSEHGSVHLEHQPTLLELVMKRLLDAGHLARELLSHTVGQHFRTGAQRCLDLRFVCRLAPHMTQATRRGAVRLSSTLYRAERLTATLAGNGNDTPCILPSVGKVAPIRAIPFGSVTTWGCAVLTAASFAYAGMARLTPGVSATGRIEGRSASRTGSRLVWHVRIIPRLNPEYAEMARRRIAGSAPMFADVAVVDELQQLSLEPAS